MPSMPRFPWPRSLSIVAIAWAYWLTAVGFNKICTLAVARTTYERWSNPSLKFARKLLNLITDAPCAHC